MAEQAAAKAGTYLQLTLPADRVSVVDSDAELARRVPALCTVPASLLTKSLYVSQQAL